MVWSPRVDIEETNNELLVRADLPGIGADWACMVEYNRVVAKQQLSSSELGTKAVSRVTRVRS